MNSGSALELVDLLVQSGVPLVVIGGHAVNFHGYLRATQDVDVVFRRTPNSEAALARVLIAANAYSIGSEIDRTTGLEVTVPVTLQYVQQTRLMMLGSDYGYIDLFDFIPALPELDLDDLLATAERAGDRPFASLQWLKRMKRASDRPQDRIDLENLP